MLKQSFPLFERSQLFLNSINTISSSQSYISKGCSRLPFQPLLDSLPTQSGLRYLSKFWKDSTQPLSWLSLQQQIFLLFLALQSLTLFVFRQELFWGLGLDRCWSFLREIVWPFCRLRKDLHRWFHLQKWKYQSHAWDFWPILPRILSHLSSRRLLYHVWVLPSNIQRICFSKACFLQNFRARYVFQIHFGNHHPSVLYISLEWFSTSWLLLHFFCFLSIPLHRSFRLNRPLFLFLSSYRFPIRLGNRRHFCI